MSAFNRWVTPLNCRDTEPASRSGTIEYEDFSPQIDVLGPMLYTLFQERWQEVQLGHVVEGSVLELEFSQPPKICVVYDGYLTVATESWHLHLCVEENLGGPHQKTPPNLRQQRLVGRAALYRSLNEHGKARSWGIQFWNGTGEKMMNLFLPNPFLGEEEDLLPENKPCLEKLALYEELRQIYVQGIRPIPYTTNPLKRPYLSVCRSSRCYPSRNWQPVCEAMQQAVAEAGLEVNVISSGCLEVCKLGPVVYYSGDDRSPELRQQTWYKRVKPEVARQIVQEHLVNGRKLTAHLYPPKS
ncbi:MAG: (2Fe-2S) ferredoxin domain-containing protein [Symploca sp. SIO1C4]|uniref:(2Fe-2S) ferredoxin domain-containing protein n=1 Tax=Symploca sp. SIO1C4 TaxID=2607765 RepID=A0A6B3N5V0_9CYAN|nr:(2Fe-2S) ferredoxin domain-containing protein [Symploca sp. SIO1C4]